MYASEVNDRKLTFQVSGMLWQRSLVMRDLETKTLWSHLLGRGMRGKLEGVQLVMLPAVMTTWKEWGDRHPETTDLAMSRTAGQFNEQLWQQPERYVFGIPLAFGLPAPAVAMTKLNESSYSARWASMVICSKVSSQITLPLASPRPASLSYSSVSAEMRVTPLDISVLPPNCALFVLVS